MTHSETACRQIEEQRLQRETELTNLRRTVSRQLREEFQLHHRIEVTTKSLRETRGLLRTKETINQRLERRIEDLEALVHQNDATLMEQVLEEGRALRRTFSENIRRLDEENNHLQERNQALTMQLEAARDRLTRLHSKHADSLDKNEQMEEDSETSSSSSSDGVPQRSPLLARIERGLKRKRSIDLGKRMVAQRVASGEHHPRKVIVTSAAEASSQSMRPFNAPVFPVQRSRFGQQRHNLLDRQVLHRRSSFSATDEPGDTGPTSEKADTVLGGANFSIVPPRIADLPRRIQQSESALLSDGQSQMDESEIPSHPQITKLRLTSQQINAQEFPSWLPAEVRTLILEQLEDWDYRRPSWSRSKAFSMSKCLNQKLRKLASDCDPDMACFPCEATGRVCARYTGLDVVTLVPLGDEARSGTRSDKGYWIRDAEH